ncbi:MAG: InlB B-repeat-containing protein, partial [Dysgonamonadaceae bacterium]|nr:InlB B-repeat-containing protein [Dysgonamonadaceae bacterium]
MQLAGCPQLLHQTKCSYGATISAPADPTRSGYVFNLWYADSNLTQRFDFATQTITADTMLYAKWWSGGVGD